MPTVDDPKLYASIKQEADKLYKKPSAYKSGWIVKTYKQRGGTYSDDNQEKKLKRWFKEEWGDIGGKDYPVYRPFKRVTSETPLTASEIDPEHAKKQISLKQKIKGENNLPPFRSKDENINKEYLNSVLDSLHKHYGKDVELFFSTRKDKKFMVKNPNGKWVHFGQQGYEDWHSHKDPKRRDLFRKRNAKWANAEKWTPAHLAFYVLW